MIHRIILFISLILLSANIFSQGIKGKIIDDTKNPVIGVSIYFKEIQTGTTTNTDGFYEIGLPEGEYTLTFQALGFSKQEFRISISDKWHELDVTLLPVQFRLKEVTIYAGEDPAYAIMRKAIGLAPFYLRQVKNYEAEIYLKGSIEVKKMPKILQKQIDKDDGGMNVGDTFTSESLNKVRFAAPDTIEHTVLAVRTSFPGMSQESAAMSYMNMSLYEPDNDMFISPLSPQALRHYNFRYDGFIDDGEYTVNKINVIPKRKSQQLWKGDLYIVENLWCIYSADLEIETFAGTVSMRQIYNEVKDRVWLPVTHIFNFDINMIGMNIGFDYVGGVKYLSVNASEAQKTYIFQKSGQVISDKKEDTVIEEKPQPQTKNQKKIDEILSKDEMTNRDMVKLAGLIEKEHKPAKEDVVLEIKSNKTFEILKDSINRDSLFWNTIRPVPLTAKENAGFEKQEKEQAKEKEQVNKKNKRKKVTISVNEMDVYGGDSQNDTSIVTNKNNNFWRISSKIVFGGSFPNKLSKVRFDYGGLISLNEFDFNPVDGFKYGQNIGLRWQQDSVNSLNIKVNGGYAFSRKLYYGGFNINQTYSPLRRGSVSIHGNIGSCDYSTTHGIHHLVFASWSLFFKDNHPRFYDNKSLSVKNSIDLTNGLIFNFSGSYFWAAPLENNTVFSIFYKDKKDYKPNEITNLAVNDSNFDEQRTFFLNAKLSYTPYQRYYIYNGKKHYASSRYPTFTLGIEQGIKAISSDADYLLAEIGAFKKPDYSFKPVFFWDVNAGWFIINKQVHFSRFKHFEAIRIPLLTRDLMNGFFMLNSYEASTNKWFIRANGAFSAPYVFLKYLPFLSNKLWNENIHVGYLHTPDFQHYTQIGYSISRIFLAGNIGVFAGFSNWEYKHWGVRIAFSFD